MAYLIYVIRLIVWTLGTLRRRLTGAPDYVVFTLESPYAQFDHPRGWPWQRLARSPVTSLHDLAAHFRRVTRDPRVKGVVLHLRSQNAAPMLQLAYLQTLRDLIQELRSSGKRVYAWSPWYDMSTYYVATAADEILLQPGGSVGPLGFAGSFVFLKTALERVGIRADFVQTSAYKSAADVLTRSEMSDEAREMATWLVESDYEEMLRDIAKGRRVDAKRARALVDTAPYTDQAAIDAGVVDRLISEEDLPAQLATTAVRPARLSPWETARKQVFRTSLSRPGRYVALLRIEGDIVDGRSRRAPFQPPIQIPFLLSPRAGDLTVVQEARRIAADRRAAAVVVYVNSGGGSATASEAIAAALEKLAAKKPLVAAMGPVAASGGYYVATPARWLLAQPGTLTGSIGVVSGKIVDAGVLGRMAIHRETISRGLHATMNDRSKPYTETERGMVRALIDRLQDVFAGRVERHRNLTRRAVDAIAGGRVWTGHQALERGLVDELGGLEASVDKARELAGLSERVAVREVRAGMRPMAPLPQPAGVIDHALAGLALLNHPAGLYLCPLIFED